MFILIKLKHIIAAAILLAFAVMLSFLCISHTEAVTDIHSDNYFVYLPIIMYHEVKQNRLGKDVISPYEFESDLKYLKDNGYNTITMTDLIGYVYNNESLPEKPIIISFDDGYLNNYKYAFPLLKKYHAKMVLSLIGKNTDDFTRIPDNNPEYSHVTWNQLNEMLATGLVEVQNHTYNLHCPKGRVGCAQKPNESLANYERILTEDLTTLQDKLIEHTGRVPNTFTYPYGKANKNTVDIVKKLGFQATLSCKYGINIVTNDPETLYDLKRICRSHGTSIERVLTRGYKTIK